MVRIINDKKYIDKYKFLRNNAVDCKKKLKSNIRSLSRKYLVITKLFFWNLLRFIPYEKEI